MTKITFAKGIEYLNAYYVNFKVDLDNKLVQQVWYGALSGIPDEDFEALLIDYAKRNIYPPQSPTHLLEHYKTMFDETVDSVILELTSLRNENLIQDGSQLRYDYEKMKEKSSQTTQLLIDAYLSRQINDFKKDTIVTYLKSIKTPIKRIGIG